MTRAPRRLLALAAALVLVLSACAPVAQLARDVLDTSDGATLSYLFRSETTLPGLAFDAGDAPALGAILIARGSELEVLGTPEGVACNATPEIVDCRLGDVAERSFVFLTGRNVIASVTYRREGATTVFQTFAR